MTLATQVQTAIERYLSTAFSLTTVTEVHDGGFEDLLVKKTPINAITSVTNTNTSSVVVSTTYAFYPEEGRIFLDSGEKWDASVKRKWSIEYIYGVGSIPEDIQLAIDTWVAMLTADSSGNLTSYKTGDDSETYGSSIGGMPPVVKAILDRYKGPRTIF